MATSRGRKDEVNQGRLFRENREDRLTGSKTLDEGRASGILEDTGKELSSRGQVGRPAKPSGVSSIQVRVDIDCRKLLECVVDRRLH